MQPKASSWFAAHLKGTPASTAPRENTSLAVASSTLAIAPPADSPLTNTRVASTAACCSRWATICRIEVTCGPWRDCWALSYQPKQPPLAEVCNAADDDCELHPAFDHALQLLGDDPGFFEADAGPAVREPQRLAAELQQHALVFGCE